MWSSHGMTPYMGYTVHTIDDQWQLRSYTLGTRFVPESHTGDVLGSAMKDTLADWGLSPDNQVYLTTDNGANIVKAARDLNWERTSCFGHNLHLGIMKAKMNHGWPDVSELEGELSPNFISASLNNRLWKQHN